ncbi:hypothetical protein [Paenibacillus donghaensis]|uniref:Uncharacterized protein n=1 Tax=Paenibacillus donghaensis TaxID=414771 RepID=A0A2Z2KAZ4_9BACL|nr:hypothetical protein [Paenibacillus donghaensis]ASA22687.1 hypothetical protein B9T62_18950 [Paenibacillus donghaensis]
MSLQPTYGKFEIKGIITGLSNTKAYTDGQTENGQWNRLQFGVRVSSNAFVYVEMMGNKSDKIKMFKVDPMTKRYDKNNHIMVNWNEKYSHKYKSYKYFQPVKINLNGLDREDIKLIAYDATEHLRDNLKDGSSVLIKGSLRFNEYKGETQESFIITEIYSIDEASLLNESYFTQEIVFMDIKKVISSKYNVNTKLIIRNSDGFDIIPYKFVINIKDKSSVALVEYFQSNIQVGSTLKIHGNIRNYVPMTLSDDGYEVIAGSSIKELEIVGGNLSSLVQGRYKPEELESDVIHGSPFDDIKETKVDKVNKFGF